MAIRVLLVNPNQMQPPIAPVGLDYLGDALADRKFEVRLLDLCFHPKVTQPIIDALHDFRPHVIGVSVRNTDDCYYAGRDFVLPRIKHVLQTIREKSSAPVVLGGVGFSIAPKETLEFLDGDFGIEGEGEEAYCELVEGIARGGDPIGIPGLLFRRKGQTIHTVPKFSQVDSFPAHTRRFVDNARYFKEGGQIGFETKRGCTMACIYCADPVAKGRQIRMRSPGKVVDELKALLDQGVDHFHTCDSEFNVPEDHGVAVCEAITAAGLAGRIRWYAYCAPTPFSHELAGAMKEAGCAGVDFGADSGDDEMLANLKRHFKSDDLRRTARVCREYEIPFMYDLLIGGPGETFMSVKHTINLMKEIGPDCVGTAIGVRVYSGTRIAEMVRNEGPIETNPALHGVKEDNPGFIKPLFYISPAVGSGVEGYVEQLIGGDPRFFLVTPEQSERNYNYNDNTILVNAIKHGYRGAYWDILRRLRLEGRLEEMAAAVEGE
ncbi:MAG: radical SAM protein [Armatimonadota bacterium]|nr:radical SAM protein [Armatimonadota bacterium]